MARRKKYPLIENLEIIDIADGGKALGKSDNMVIFVEGVVPGDIVNVQIRKKRKKYLEGNVIEVIKESESRTDPFCQHFGVCGGCKWQNLAYKQQLHFKQLQVANNLQRIGEIEIPEINPILGSQNKQFYRNKLEFTFTNTRWLSEKEINSDMEIKDRRALGFHIPGRFDRILHIDTCYLQDSLSDKIRNEVRKFALSEKYSFYDQRLKKGLLRNLIIRNTELGEWMVIVVFQENDKDLVKKLLEHVKNNFPEITSLMYVINPKVNDTIHDLDVHLFSGQDHIIEKLEDLKFKIGPKSFFQTNTLQALELYRIALQFADLKGNEIVYDLYTGTGTIANYIARKSKKVIGLEYVEDAILDAEANAKLNQINNTSFYTGDIKDLLSESFIKDHGRPGVIISDPPRAGMHASVVQSLLNIQAHRIIYISCNPATQARDIRLLSEKYKVIAVQPVDMFPHTGHVENVVRLDLK